MDYLMVVAGLVLLIFGGEGLVRGSVAVARKLNISELVIGLTLVGCGTSMPELVTSLRAIDTGAVGISIGNVMGSNVANILLVLGAAALVRPILTNPSALKRDAAVVIVATAALCWLIWLDAFTRLSGFLLLTALVLYIALSLIADQRGDTPEAEMHVGEGEIVEAPYGIVKGLLIALAGLMDRAESQPSPTQAMPMTNQTVTGPVVFELDGAMFVTARGAETLGCAGGRLSEGPATACLSCMCRM